MDKEEIAAILIDRGWVELSAELTDWLHGRFESPGDAALFLRFMSITMMDFLGSQQNDLHPRRID